MRNTQKATRRVSGSKRGRGEEGAGKRRERLTHTHTQRTENENILFHWTAKDKKEKDLCFEIVFK